MTMPTDQRESTEVPNSRLNVTAACYIVIVVSDSAVKHKQGNSVVGNCSN